MSVDFKLPELGENISEGDIVKVLVAEGDRVSKDQPLVEVETDKAAIEVPAETAGVVGKIMVKVGERAKVGQTLLTLENNGASKAAPEAAVAQKTVRPAAEPAATETVPPANPEITHSQPSNTTALPAPAAPSVRRLARELNVDILKVQGSGPRGMIRAVDVKRLAESQYGVSGLTDRPAPAGLPVAAPLPDFSKWGAVRTEAMSNVRRKTAEHLSQSWATIPNVTQHDEADTSSVETFRRSVTKLVAQQGGKLTITAIALKVAAAALKKFPKFNASIDMQRQQIVYKEYVHIGVAVDTERGLLVPVIRDVDTKNLTELSRELAEISERARNKKITPDDMTGGTFTITNLGGIGGVGFTPIVNAPEVAILGISRGSVQQRYIEGQFVPRTVTPLALSYDHRIIDGADAARFLRWVAQTLEQPFMLTLED